MLIRIDPQRAEPLYDQLSAGLREQLIAGTLRPGQTLPAARELAASLGVNLHTVLRAYQCLRDEGLVDMRRGRGAVVTERAARLGELRAEIDALAKRAAALGFSRATVASLIKENRL
ncbi:MAG: GntR family transcriptional regulator [Candidatus Nanopelagicales bacterium]